MKFVYILFALVAIVKCNEECKQRRNYISYRVSGETEVVGVRKHDVHRAIKSALNVWEETVEDLWFVKDPIYESDYELNIEFVSFTERLNHTRFVDNVAVTFVNCTSNNYQLEVIKTIYNATIYLNTDYAFKYNYDRERHHRNKFDLQITVMHEVGHSLGLRDNENPLSIMYRLAHILDIRRFNRSKIPEDDLDEINKLYVLKNQENVWKI